MVWIYRSTAIKSKCHPIKIEMLLFNNRTTPHPHCNKPIENWTIPCVQISTKLLAQKPYKCGLEIYVDYKRYMRHTWESKTLRLIFANKATQNRRQLPELPELKSLHKRKTDIFRYISTSNLIGRLVFENHFLLTLEISLSWWHTDTSRINAIIYIILLHKKNQYNSFDW